MAVGVIFNCQVIRNRITTKMHEWFWFGTNLGSFLFPHYNITTTWGLLATCFGLIALAVIYEAMKLLQIKLHRLNQANLLPDDSASEDSSLLKHFVPQIFQGSRGFRCWMLGQWLLEVIHYAAHNTLGYLLMLAAMTFNGYICIALVTGAAVGYHVFGPAFLNLNLNELRQRYKVIPCAPECIDAIAERPRDDSRQSIVSAVAEQLVSEVNAEVHNGGTV